jgi:hypothetical protein
MVFYCFECAHWEPAPNWDDGQCMRHAPQAQLVRGETESPRFWAEWPVVLSEWRCGDGEQLCHSDVENRYAKAKEYCDRIEAKKSALRAEQQREAHGCAPVVPIESCAVALGGAIDAKCHACFPADDTQEVTA